MQLIDYIVLVSYFVGMIAIGFWAMKRVKDQEDYFMGGRGFGKLLQTFAAFGAGTGAHEPVMVGKTAWTSGLSGVWSALMWLFVTPIYWITAVWYRRMRHLTLGDWFVERYESRSMALPFSFLIAYRKYKYLFFLGVVAILLNIFINYFFIAKYGMIIAAFSTFLSQFVINFGAAFFSYYLLKLNKYEG